MRRYPIHHQTDEDQSFQPQCKQLLPHQYHPCLYNKSVFSPKSQPHTQLFLYLNFNFKAILLMDIVVFFYIILYSLSNKRECIFHLRFTSLDIKKVWYSIEETNRYSKNWWSIGQHKTLINLDKFKDKQRFREKLLFYIS